jgi:hypothetical protein
MAERRARKQMGGREYRVHILRADYVETDTYCREVQEDHIRSGVWFIP